MMVKIFARFVDAGTGLPLKDSETRVRLYDKDPVNDDFLGETRLTQEGQAEWIFPLSAAGSFDSPGEKRPDIYIELIHEGNVYFQSPVSLDMDLDAKNPVTGEYSGRTRFLGTFNVTRPPSTKR